MLERYYRELLGFLSRKVSDRALAADLTQESYARVYAAQASGTRVAEGRALLYQTAKHLLIDHHRRIDVRASVEVPPAHDESPDGPGPATLEPEAAVSSQQSVMALVTAIDGLPPRCREAFMLNRFDGLSYAQVAARMGVSVKAVEQHIKHALDICERSHQLASGSAVTPSGPRKKLNRSRHD